MMEQLLSWVKLPKHLAWPLVIVSALLLWGPDGFKNGLGLQPFIDDYRNWFGIIFLFFLVIGLQPLASFITKKILNIHFKQKQEEDKAKKDRQEQEQTEEKIKNLTPGEKNILRYYIENNIRSQDLNIQNGEVSKLLSDGFIYLASRVSYGGRRGSFTFPVNIDDWAWEYIHKKPEVLN